MRAVGRVLGLLVGAAVLPQASARPEPERPVPASVVPRVALASSPAPRREPARVVEVAPTGERVPLDAPLVVRFEGGVPRDDLRIDLVPAVAGEAKWFDPTTWSFSPTQWRPGRAHEVRVSAPNLEPVGWRFRARVPMPLAIPAGEGSRIILTFDDGPNDRRQADRALDRLQELGVRALFFPTGRWAATRPDWVARAKAEGHRVCNHTYSHVNLTAPWMTEARIRDEIARGATDGECKLFRPPLMGVDGRVERIARELGYEVYLWDIDSRDWEGAPAEDVLARVVGRAGPDRVVLFHLHADSTFEILPLLVRKLREAGYVLSWDPTDAPPGRVGAGGRREWGALADRPNDAELPQVDADGSGLGPP